MTNPNNDPSFWQKAPLIRVLIPLLGGMVWQFYQHTGSFGMAITVILIILILLLSELNFPPGKRSIIRLTGFLILLCFFCFGSLMMYLHRDIRIVETVRFPRNQPGFLILRVISDPVAKPQSMKCIGELQWLSTGGHCYTAKEKLLVYFRENPDSCRIRNGDMIIARNVMKPIENSGISDFDYQKFCRQRHIYAQIFLKGDDYEKQIAEKEKTPFSFLAMLRNHLRAIIRKYISGKAEYGLLEALMVGYTDDLDPAILKSYADAGVVHIIAISGLHLALICHILQQTVGRLGKKSGKWKRFILIIGVLWGYSLLSGASPSVIRSAMMFSLVLFGRCILRESLLYNVLAASALLLLCFNPGWLWDPGFQLSYAAVLSLLLFSTPIRRLIPLENKSLKAVWEAASVSLAAQILTTPVSIFYFHRFPTYFLFANLLAVPLSSAILAGGISLCCFGFVQPLGQGLGWLLACLIRYLNMFVLKISAWPGAVIAHLSLTITQMVLLYFFIFAFYRCWIAKEKSWIFAVLGSLCLLQLSRWLPAG